MRSALVASLLVLVCALPVRGQDAALSPCGVRTRSAPVLTRYDAIVPGARFRVTLRHDAASRSWTPSPQLAMPLHHASALEYVGYTLPPPGRGTLELEVEGIERIAHGPREGTFFFTYRVRVLGACWVE